MLLESYMVITGTTRSPFDDTTQISYISAPWIDTLKVFLWTTGTRITTPKIDTPFLLRQHDETIMLLAVNKQYKRNQLIAINKCRFWLQVCTLAEISDIDAVEFYHKLFLVKQTPRALPAGTPSLWNISRLLLKWPKQKTPSKKDCKVWQSLMRQVTTTGTNLLKTTLGRWIPNSNEQRRWLYHINNTSDVVIRNHENKNIEYYKIHRRTVQQYQIYYKTNTQPNTSTSWHPIAPSQIGPDSIRVNNIHLSHISANSTPFLTTHITTTTTTPPHSTHQTIAAIIYIGIHTTLVRAANINMEPVVA
jgi:hypothetical protein